MISLTDFSSLILLRMQFNIAISDSQDNIVRTILSLVHLSLLELVGALVRVQVMHVDAGC